MSSENYIVSKAWGHGLATLSADGTVLDVWYPNPALGEAPKSEEKKKDDGVIDAEVVDEKKG